ncbi:TniQ family protein [Mycolicibacterium sp. 018/SC-01/001]|uniref:TniQ family protein n=1 Tax=Mycolicibacterium sp. 018/SC-01/001 TaxID=2592069 RepID=UPI002105D57B|nr:TniQ family protein [Mycolicibacterium sp. 018/SC-01/001]
MESVFSELSQSGDGALPAPRVRTLPVRVKPLSEESLASWLEALARRLSTPWGDILDAVGLIDASNQQRRDGARNPVHLAPTERQWIAVTKATGIQHLEAQRMTLAGLMCVRAGARLPHSIHLPGSRFCPKCLAQRDGRWRTWWWLRWGFACVDHACLLVSDCPACGRNQRVRPHPREVIPNPSLCTRSEPAGGRTPKRCRQRLAEAPVVFLGENHPAIAVQRDILSVLASGSISRGVYAGNPLSVEAFFRDLAALGQRLLRYAEPTDLRALLPADLWAAIEPLTRREARQDSSPSWAVTNESSASIAAAAACLATPILLADSRAAAGEKLRWLVASMRRRGLTVSASNVGWGRNVSDALIGVQLTALRVFLGPVDQLRHRGGTRRPSGRDSAAPLSHSLPALLWPRCAFRFETGGVGFDQLRGALSVAILLVGSRTPAPTACALLGLATHERSVSRVLQRLRARTDWEQLMASLIGLRDQLEAGVPVDYARRRALDYAGLLPIDQWRAICVEVAMPAGRSMRARLHRGWLYERLSGSPAVALAPGRGDSAFRASLADLPRTLTPALVAALDDAGREFLRSQGVRDEPLRWRPDLCDVLAGSAYYQRAEARVSEIHRLVTDGHPLGWIAGCLNTTINVVREVLTEYPAS